MKGANVSLFRRANKPDDVATATVGAVLEGIRCGRWEAPVSAVRAARTKEERKRLKLGTLPAVAFSGTFGRRANDALREHTGFVCLDFDGVDDPEALRNGLAQHSHIAAAFVSVSGTGVKALVPVEVVDAKTGEYRSPADDAEHKAVCANVFALFPLASLDTGCRDVARLCFVSHDPELRANADAVPVTVELAPNQTAEPAPDAPPLSTWIELGSLDAERVRNALEAIPPRPAYPEWVRVIASVRAAVGDDHTAEALLRAWSPEETPGEYADKLRNGLDRVGAGTLFWLAREHGWTWERDEARARVTGPVRASEQPLPAQPTESEKSERGAERDAQAASVMPWIPFPVDTLPSAVRDYVQDSAAAIGCDVTAVALPALAALASAVGNSFRIRLKNGWDEPSTLWVCVVMPSGSAKSPAWKAALDPVFDLERECRDKYAAALEAFEEERRVYDALPKAEKEGQSPPVHPTARRMRVSDATVESIMQVHEANPRGLLLARDELAGWIGSFDRYSKGGGDLQSWIEMHDGKPVVVDRKTGDFPTLYVDRPSVCVAGTSQPSVIREGLTGTHFGSGFAPRLLIAEPPTAPRTWTEEDLSANVSAAYHRLIQTLYALPNGAGDVRLSEAAKEHFIGWVNRNGKEQDQLPDGPLRAACSKIEAKAARLALVFALAEAAEVRLTPADGFEVSECAMARAVRLALWVRYETARLYRLHGFERRAMNPDAACVMELPEVFAWQDVAKAWGVQRAGAYKVIARITERGYVESAGHGKYRRLLSRAAEGGSGRVDFGDFGTYSEPIVSKVYQSTVSPGCPGQGNASDLMAEPPYPFADLEPAGTSAPDFDNPPFL